MFIIKALVIAVLLIPLTPIQATDSESAITVHLQQAVDANCDGVSDSAFSSSGNKFTILPQQCVIYKITAQNLSNQYLTNITLTGNIPQYTQLQPNSISVYENEKLRPAVAYQSVNSAQVKAEQMTLAPFKTLNMIYSILIN